MDKIKYYNANKLIGDMIEIKSICEFFEGGGTVKKLKTGCHVYLEDYFDLIEKYIVEVDIKMAELFRDKLSEKEKEFENL